MKKTTRRVVIVFLGLFLVLVPFVLCDNLKEREYSPFDRHEVLNSHVYEYSCVFNGGTPLTSSEYFDLKDVFAERMEYGPIEDISIFCSEEADSAVIQVGYEGDMFLDYKQYFDILTCKGQVQLVTFDVDDDENMIFWLDNEDFASAMDNSKYDPNEGNSYGVLFRIKEDSLEKYNEMLLYANENNTEIFVVLDEEIIDSTIVVDSGEAPSKNTGYGTFLVRTKTIEQNTRLMMIGTAPILNTTVELKEE